MRPFFPGGMPDTIWGSSIPKSAQHGPIYSNLFLCWAVFSTPHMCERWKKRPTKKVNNRIRPLETNFVSGRIGWAQQKTYLGHNLAPIQRMFDLADAFVFPGGMLDTMRGSKIPESAPKTAQFAPMCSYFGELFPPLL